MNGMIFEKKSGVARFFTGVVVAPEEQRQGIGSKLRRPNISTPNSEEEAKSLLRETPTPRRLLLS